MAALAAMRQMVMSVVFAGALGASAVQACGGSIASPRGASTADGSGGQSGDNCADAGVGSCCDVCRRADDCCLAATPQRDGAIPCTSSLSCGDPSIDQQQLIDQCQALLSFYPLNPACQ